MEDHNVTLRCPICYENINYQNIHITPCGHIFHQECMIPISDGKCPQCRYQIHID